MFKKLFFLLFFMFALLQMTKAGSDTDTAWTRQTIGENITDVKFSPVGNIVATAHQDFNEKNNGVVRLWNVSTGEIIKILPTYSSFNTSLAFSNDGRYLYTGSQDGYGLLKWDLTTYQIIKKYFILDSSHINTFCISNDNTKIYAVGYINDSIARSPFCVIDEKSGKIIKDIENIEYGYINLKISSDNKYLSVLTNYYNQGTRYKLILWDANTYQKIKVLEDTTIEIYDFAFSYDGTTLFDCLDGTLSSKIWSIPSGNLIKQYKPKQIMGIMKLIYFKAPNKTFITFSTFDFKAKYAIYDPDKDNLDYQYDINFGSPKAMDISNDQTKIVCGIGDYLYLFNYKTTGVIEQNKENLENKDIIIPNPMQNKATIKFNLPEQGVTKLTLLAENGSQLNVLYNSYLNSGINEITVPLPNIASGNYFVNIQGKNYNKALKLTILK